MKDSTLIRETKSSSVEAALVMDGARTRGNQAQDELFSALIIGGTCHARSRASVQATAR